jgi:uncharacterized protein YdbL (DUF1318 family)
MKKLLTAICLVFFLQTAWAIDIDSAKSQGLVGEAYTGYLAAVETPASAEVQTLIRQVNAKRKAEFESTAQSTGATLEQVAFRFYELAVQRTVAGHFYQDKSGRWVKK